MRTLVVDDERLARVELRRLLRDEVEIVGEASHAEEAVAEIDRLAPDLVFLDVEMPGGTGFDVLERVERAPLVVFTTAYEAHALRAFEVNALDYLLKPVEPARLAAALERARGRLPATEHAGGFLERVFVRDGAFCRLVDLRAVPLLESEGNYTRLHIGPEQPLLARSLSYLEERLDPRAFVRANRRELVNMAFVRAVEPEGAAFRLRLDGGREIEMSRRQAQRFRHLMRP